MAYSTIIDNTKRAIARLKALSLVTRRRVNANSSPFLRMLPAEIRNDIYSKVLIQAGSVKPSEVVDLIALLCVCSQIRDEAAPIFYSKDQFQVELDVSPGGHGPSSWLRAISEENSSSMTSILVCLKSPASDAAISSLDFSKPREVRGQLESRIPRTFQPIELLADKLLLPGVAGNMIEWCPRCTPQDIVPADSSLAVTTEGMARAYLQASLNCSPHEALKRIFSAQFLFHLRASLRNALLGTSRNGKRSATIVS